MTRSETAAVTRTGQTEPAGTPYVHFEIRRGVVLGLERKHQTIRSLHGLGNRLQLGAILDASEPGDQGDAELAMQGGAVQADHRHRVDIEQLKGRTISLTIATQTHELLEQHRQRRRDGVRLLMNEPILFARATATDAVVQIRVTILGLLSAALLADTIRFLHDGDANPELLARSVGLRDMQRVVEPETRSTIDRSAEVLETEHLLERIDSIVVVVVVEHESRQSLVFDLKREAGCLMSTQLLRAELIPQWLIVSNNHRLSSFLTRVRVWQRYLFWKTSRRLEKVKQTIAYCPCGQTQEARQVTPRW
jgi:hypothetical protein